MRRASLVLVNDRKEIGRIREFVERFGLAHHLTAHDVHAVNLVLDELVINVITHGYDDDRSHEIGVSLSLDDDILTIRVEDDARPFNLLEAPPPDLDLPIEQRPIGGLGIHIVRSMTDAIEHRRTGGRNVVTLRKRIVRDDAGAAS